MHVALCVVVCGCGACACACARARVRMRARVCGCLRWWVSLCACVHARLAAPSCGASIVPEEDQSVSSRERTRGRVSRRRGAAAAAESLRLLSLRARRRDATARHQRAVPESRLPSAPSLRHRAPQSALCACRVPGARSHRIASWHTLRCGGCMHCRNALCGAATGGAAVDARRQAVLCGEPARRQLEHRHAHPLCYNVLRCAALNSVAPPCNALRRLATRCAAGTLGRSLLNAVSLGSFSSEWYPARY
jgi:hypothetical protein